MSPLKVANEYLSTRMNVKQAIRLLEAKLQTQTILVR
jgi:hypothetical protein